MNDLQSFVQSLRDLVKPPAAAPEPDSMEAVLKGLAIELWSDAAGGFWLVADEEDVLKLGEPRGQIFTAREYQLLCRITDPTYVAEITCWKREFNATIRKVERSENEDADGRGL